MDPHHLPRHIDQIIEAQIHRWELARKAREKEAAAEEKPARPWPIITVSREFGSQGAAVGKLVAEKLGFAFWDQELVHEIAKRTGARETLVASLDEHVRSRLDDFVAHVFRGGEGASDEYVRQVAHVLHTLERHGAAVVIGRGGQFVVRGEHALRTRFVSPRSKRIRGFAQREKLESHEAERKVDATENERRVFFRQHFDRDVAEPSYYDVVINTGTISLETACDVVIAAYKAKFDRLPG